MQFGVTVYKGVKLQSNVEVPYSAPTATNAYLSV